ncbi:MAG: glycosyltransferase [Desulfuromonadaceae bacterium]
MKIVHLCSMDFGGAGKAAHRLHKGLQESGVDSCMVVVCKKNSDESVYAIPSELSHAPDKWWTLLSNNWKKSLADYPLSSSDNELFSDFCSVIPLDPLQKIIQAADVINLHWVAGFFDTSFMPKALHGKKIVWTLHDMNPFTGGCHYSDNCAKYCVNCGSCPQLASVAPKDLSFSIWEKKREAYRHLDITVATPSKWLCSCSHNSSLLGHFRHEIIPNGFPLSIFKPVERQSIRSALNIPLNARVILFCADSTTSKRKGFSYLVNALMLLSQSGRSDDLILAVIGANEYPEQEICSIPVLSFGHINDEDNISLLYNAADVFVLPSLEDNLPNTAVEALASGTPVAAFDIGGVPDIIDHKITGYLAPAKDVAGLAEAISWCLNDAPPSIRKSCREKAEAFFAIETQANNYKKLYESIRSPLLPSHTAIKKSSPKISIVTPSYNQAEYLQECIDSILSQNYPNLEYIIIDGGSTDGSVDIIKRYSRFLTFWQSHPDGGQYEAINEGFRRSTGDIMTWLNSDDMFLPDAFNTVARIFVEYPDVQWVMGRPNGIDKSGHQTWVFDYLPLWNREKYLKKQYREPYIQQEGTFWRRSLWEKAGSNISRYFDLAGDLELWARFFRHAELYTVDASLACFRQHSRQKTARLIGSYNEEAEAILEREQILFDQSSDKTLLPPPLPLLLSSESNSTGHNSSNDCPSHQENEEISKADAYMVSAIVSLYNSERFIRGCLEDLVSQTLFLQGRLEVIVIDSASPQQEAVIIREFQERYPNIQYFRTDQRETVYAAWNRGIALARGRYITNANTDDRHRSDAFELMVRVMESRPVVDLVYADVLITKTPNETFEHHTPCGKYTWYEWDRNLLLDKGCFIGPQPMWRRSLHQLYGGFDPSCVTSGDYEFWLRISQTSDFFHIRQPLGLYLAHPDSIEHQNEDRKGSENRKILDRYRQAVTEGAVVGLIPLEQIRTLDTKFLNGRSCADLTQLVNFIDGMLTSKAALSGSRGENYNLIKGRLLESGGTSVPLIEEYVRSVEHLLLNSKDWYMNRRSAEEMGADESGLRLEILSTAIHKARLLFQRGEVVGAVSVLLNQGIKAAASSPVAYFELAEILMAAERYDDALQVLPEMPPTADVCRMQEISVICHAALGDNAVALQTAKLVPERPRVLVVRGTLAARGGNPSQAETLFRLAVDRDPSCGNAWLSLGMLLWGNGNQEDAYQAVRQAVVVDPLNDEAVIIMRDMAERLG